MRVLERGNKQTGGEAMFNRYQFRLSNNAVTISDLGIPINPKWEK